MGNSFDSLFNPLLANPMLWLMTGVDLGEGAGVVGLKRLKGWQNVLSFF